MTIVFTSGYPYSGKTEFAKELTKVLKKHKVVHIDPSTLRPADYDSLDSEAQSKARIATWEVSQEMLTTNMKEPTSNIIIFDTCAAKSKNMLPHFQNAKVHKHNIVYVFIGATLIECKQRAGPKWISNDVIDSYARDFNESVPKLRDASSKFFFIKNNNDNERLNLKAAAQKVAKVITNGSVSGIFEPKPLRSSVNRTGQKDNKRTKVQPNRPH